MKSLTFKAWTLIGLALANTSTNASNETSQMPTSGRAGELAHLQIIRPIAEQAIKDQIPSNVSDKDRCLHLVINVIRPIYILSYCPTRDIQQTKLALAELAIAQEEIKRLENINPALIMPVPFGKNKTISLQHLKIYTNFLEKKIQEHNNDILNSIPLDESFINEMKEIIKARLDVVLKSINSKPKGHPNSKISFYKPSRSARGQSIDGASTSPRSESNRTRHTGPNFNIIKKK